MQLTLGIGLDDKKPNTGAVFLSRRLVFLSHFILSPFYATPYRCTSTVQDRLI